MKTLDEIKKVLLKHKEELKEEYKIKEIGIFGSYVKGEQNNRSDIDIIIEFGDEDSIEAFEFIGLMDKLEKYIQKILGIKPHLASKRHAMSSERWKSIEKEVLWVFQTMDKEKKVKGIIVSTLDQSGVVVKKIILFGSRAKGNINKYSDYDLLIVTEKTFSVREKMGISRKLRIALAEFAVDIIIKSEDEVKVQKDLIGTIVREALKEGVPI